jgi:hypothetical protein
MKGGGVMGTAGVVALSALAAGVLDISATGTLRKTQGVPFRKVLQGVASGAIGGAALEGGAGWAWVGLGLHFLIALIWAGIYFVAADVWPVLQDRPWLCGAIYGPLVHLVMSRVVLPLSRAKRPFSWEAWLTQLAIHVVCVGWPIALVQSYGR